MSDQLSLDGFDSAPKPTDRLFFALFPDEQTAQRMARFAQDVCAEESLMGRPVKHARLHVTLHHLGDYAGLPPAVVRAAQSAAAQMSATEDLALTFDRLQSFHGSHGKRTLVLSMSSPPPALLQFQAALGTSMARTPGLARLGDRQFTPHVTLHYGWRAVEPRDVPPMSWVAREFVLVHSLLDRTTHLPLGRWPLRGGNSA